jgi:hypothetical protein
MTHSYSIIFLGPKLFLMMLRSDTLSIYSYEVRISGQSLI